MIPSPELRAQLARAGEHALAVVVVLSVAVGAVHVVVLGQAWALVFHTIAVALVAPVLVSRRSSGRHHARPGHTGWAVRR